MLAWVSAAFLAVIGIAVILQRRPLAKAQGMVLGGTIVPGCAVAEGLLLLLLAIAIAVYGRGL